MQDRTSMYAVEALEPRRLLSAAPHLAWGSYLGGTNQDQGLGIAIDGSGNAWVTGSTNAGGWAVGGFDTSYNGGEDAFIAKINANGTLAWSSYLGGTSRDYGFDIAIDGAGNAWVIGQTASSGWAVGGFDASYNGGTDAFIAKINANGTLAWSSYLGGTESESGFGIAIDGAGNAWVTGSTASPAWAVGGFDTIHDGQRDAYVAKINADGTLAWSTYLGGTGSEGGNGISVDGSGNAWVTGWTNSPGWAVGGFDTSHGGSDDGFIAKIDANGTFAWSSYLGGTTSDEGRRIAIDGSGNAWVAGWTTSAGWALGGFDTSYNGGEDAFIAKINADSTLAWSSYLGGAAEDNGWDVAIDGSGYAWVAGATWSSDWAVGGFDTSHNGGGPDAFVAKFDADGTPAWSSYLGGAEYDRGYGMAIDGSGNAWVTGWIYSSGWAVGGFDTTYNGAGDAFIAKIIEDATPPAVVATSYSYATAPNHLRVTFTEDVSASLSAGDLIVTAVPGGAPVGVTNFTYDLATDSATFTLPTPLADGNYRARLPADAVTDPAGNPLAADYTFDFFFLRGDANHDRRVNLQDFNILAGNFGQSNRDFSQGDFNYDTVVNLQDFNLLAGRFGQVLAAPGAGASAADESRRRDAWLDELLA